MGFFNTLFGKDEEPFQMQGVIIEPFDRNIVEGIYYVPTKDKDPSKGIAFEHWDALSPEAQKTLKDQGFYPIIQI